MYCTYNKKSLQGVNIVPPPQLGTNKYKLLSFRAFYMTKGDVFGALEDVFFPKIRGLRGNSKTLNTDPYRVIPLFQVLIK